MAELSKGLAEIHGGKATGICRLSMHRSRKLMFATWYQGHGSPSGSPGWPAGVSLSTARKSPSLCRWHMGSLVPYRTLVQLRLGSRLGLLSPLLVLAASHP